MEKRKELYEAVEIVLTLEKNKYAKRTVEQEKEVLSRILFLASGSVGSKEDVKEAFENTLEKFSAVLKRLPQEIIETVEDFHELCLGFMSEQTKQLLLDYYEKEKEYFSKQI